MARSSGAAVVGSLALALAIPAAARAGLAIHSFAPASVTLGTRLVIKGDFAELAASGERPKVIGTRMDTPRTVKFQVLAISRRTIIAKVREVPSSKSDPAAGKTWSLRVRSTAGAGETAQADGTFTTAGPELVALLDSEGRPGEQLALYAQHPGEKSRKTTVTVGRKKAKVLGVAPLGPSPDDDPWVVRFRAPNLRNGFYRVQLENPIGRSPQLAELLIYGGLRDGPIPYASAAIESRPALEAPLCSATAPGGALHVTACDGAACARSLELEFAPDPAGGYRAAALALNEAGAGGADWVAARASARLLPPPAPELVAGIFVAELQPAVGSGPLLRIRGYFQAPMPEGLALQVSHSE